MADYSIISDVSNSLLRMFKESACPDPIQSSESIALCSPNDRNVDFLLGISLYDICELSEYRTTIPVIDRDNRRHKPDVPLTLHYMMFLNSKAQIAAGAEVEQRIFGKVMQIIIDTNILDLTEVNPFLRELDSESGISVNNLNFEEKTRIWTAYSVPYQMAIYFTVAPVLLSSAKSVAVSRVAVAEFSAEQLTPDKEGRD